MSMLSPQPYRQQDENDTNIVKEIAKHKAKQKFKKGAKKAAAKMAKMAIKAIKTAATALVKFLGTLLSTIGVPTLLIIGGIIILVIIISLVSSYVFSTGEGLEGEEAEIHEYIVESANNTVNMNSHWERPYRVPVELISATIQLDYFNSKSLNEVKDAIDRMSSELAPEFIYGEYNEWTEKQVLVYEDGKLVKEGKIERTDNWVKKLDKATYWNGVTNYTHTTHVTPWKSTEKITYRTETYYEPVEVTYTDYVDEKYTLTTINPRSNDKILDQWKKNEKFIIGYVNGNPIISYRTVTYYKVERTRKVPVEKTKTELVQKERKIEVKTVTKTRHQYFETTSSSITDYSYLDNVLNSFNFSIEDKSLVEANYEISAQTDIDYVESISPYSFGGGFGGGYYYFPGDIIPGAGVPPQFMPIYRAAEKEYGIPWYILAAIHFVETTFSTNPTMISSAGAIGHFQFMPATWVGWKYNIGGGLVSPSLDITDPAIIAAGGGYGVDGNGDGKADPWDIWDACFTAAHYLAKNNFANDPRKAIWHYNHADWYVQKVLDTAKKFKEEATYVYDVEGMPPLNPGGFMLPTTGPVSSPFGMRTLNGRTKFHYGIDFHSNGVPDLPIFASADGVVTRADYSNSYGYVVYILHEINGQQYETVYAHLKTKPYVTVGQEVKQGHVIGIMGNTGYSTGVHLHFEIHVGRWTVNKRNAVNPALFLGLNS